jgi:hypothetical protein
MQEPNRTKTISDQKKDDWARKNLGQKKTRPRRKSQHYRPKTDEYPQSDTRTRRCLYRPPAWLMQAITEIAAVEAPTPKAPPVLFDLSEEAVLHNTELLQNGGLGM